MRRAETVSRFDRSLPRRLAPAPRGVVGGLVAPLGSRYRPDCKRSTDMASAGRKVLGRGDRMRMDRRMVLTILRFHSIDNRQPCRRPASTIPCWPGIWRPTGRWCSSAVRARWARPPPAGIAPMPASTGTTSTTGSSSSPVLGVVSAGLGVHRGRGATGRDLRGLPSPEGGRGRDRHGPRRLRARLPARQGKAGGRFPGGARRRTLATPHARAQSGGRTGGYSVFEPDSRRRLSGVRIRRVRRAARCARTRAAPPSR